MNFIDGHLYHIYNRGNNRQLIFFNKENYRYFLHKVKISILPLADILAFCLMPNHFHFMVMVKDYNDSKKSIKNKLKTTSNGQPIHPLVGRIGHMLSSYTRAINIQEHRTGSLFTKKTQAKDISEKESSKRIKGLHPSQSPYAFNCFHYIHQNPVRAGLVEKMDDWEFSSFGEFTLKYDREIINIELAREVVGFDAENFRDQSNNMLNDEDVEGIW